MPLDQISLLTAIGFSAAALTITLFVSWVGARADTYLLSWAAGMGLIVLGVILFSVVGTHYDPAVQMISFLLLLAGFTFVYVGARQFHTGTVSPPVAFSLWGGFACAVSLAFVFGFSGVGTIIANFGIATVLVLAGREYWLGRAEAALPLIATTTLYMVTAISFALCAVVLLAQGQFVLTARPENWAEDINSIMAIISLTGIGALSVTLNQFRAARHHRRQAMTDPLTGMLNRRALFDTLSGKPVETGIAVIMFDLDHFKTINDQLGHAIGDQVLQAFAQVVQENMRAADTSARLGGEEFCIVLGQLSSRSAANVAERIRAAFELTSIGAVTGPVRATVSAGLAFCNSDSETFEQLLGRADDALYKAKSAGRNRVYTTGLRLVA